MIQVLPELTSFNKPTFWEVLLHVPHQQWVRIVLQKQSENYGGCEINMIDNFIIMW